MSGSSLPAATHVGQRPSASDSPYPQTGPGVCFVSTACVCPESLAEKDSRPLPFLPLTIKGRNLVVRALLMLAACTSGAASGQQAVFEVNRAAAARIATAIDQIRAGDVREGLSFLDQIVADSGDDLAALTDRHFVAVRLLVHRAMAGLPADVLDTCRERVDPRAAQRLTGTVSEEQLRTVLREYPLASQAAQVTDDLAWRSWRHGRPGWAYEYWRRLLPSTPARSVLPSVDQSLLTPAQVAARLILCRLATGDHRFAAREVDAFHSQFESVDGRLGSARGDLHRLLDEEFQSNRWATPASKHWEPRVLWTQPLPVAGSPEPRIGFVPPEQIARPSQAAAMSDDAVYVHDAGSVSAIRLSDGLGRFSGTADSGLLELPDPATESASGVPWFQPVVVQGRLLVRLGSPVTARPGGALVAPQSNQIWCFDVDRREGKLVWRLASSDLVPDGAFESSPVPFGSRCFVLVRTSALTVGLHLAALSVEDGRVLWTRQLCSGLDRAENRAVVTSLRPVVTPQHVLVATDNGALIAVDHEGRFAWARTYSRSPVPAPIASDPVPAIAAHAFLYVAPHDSERLCAVRETTGELAWARRLPDRIRHVLGVHNGVLIVSGRGLWGLEPATGAVLWGGPRYAPEHFGYGRGAIVGSTVLFPTRDQVELRDLQTGIGVHSPMRIPGGNVTARGRRVVITGADSIRVLRGVR